MSKNSLNRLGAILDLSKREFLKKNHFFYFLQFRFIWNILAKKFKVPSHTSCGLVLVPQPTSSGSIKREDTISVLGKKNKFSRTLKSICHTTVKCLWQLYIFKYLCHVLNITLNTLHALSHINRWETSF